MIDHVELREGLYRDSVTLMLLTRTLSQDTTISDPIVAMATPLNLDLARTAGYKIPDGSGSQLLIALRADEDEVALCLETLHPYGLANEIPGLDYFLVLGLKRVLVGSLRNLI